MDRRTFLKSGVVATAGIGTASVAVAAPVIRTTSSVVLKTAISEHFTRGYLRDRADRFAQRLKDMTDGRLTIELIPELQGCNAIAHVQNGDVVAYFGTEANHLKDHRGLAYFGGLPGGLGLSPEHFAVWLNGGGGQLYWDDIAADLGVKSFAVGHSGRRAGLWAARDIESLAGLAGSRANVTGIAGLMAKRFGMVPGAADLISDVVEPLMGPTAWLADNRLGQYRTWYRSGFHSEGVILSFGISRDIWQSIGAADQVILAACANEAYCQSLAEHDAHDIAVAPHLFRAYGIQKRILPNDISRAVRRYTVELLSEWRADNPVLARIHTSYMQFRDSMAYASFV